MRKIWPRGGHGNDKPVLPTSSLSRPLLPPVLITHPWLTPQHPSWCRRLVGPAPENGTLIFKTDQHSPEGLF